MAHYRVDLQKSVKPLCKLEFDSAFRAMLDFGVQIFFVDQETFDDIEKADDNGKKLLMEM